MGIIQDYYDYIFWNISFSLYTFLSLVKNCNHKRLGIYYLLSAFIIGVSATLISVLMRIELYSTGNRIISPENQNFYNVSITLHGLEMIFFLCLDCLEVLEIILHLSFKGLQKWYILESIIFLSYFLAVLSFVSEFGGGTGWTLYPPLSTSFMSLSPSATAYLVFGLLMSGISSCLSSINFFI